MEPSAYDHVRPGECEYPAGVYRVVGTSGGRVTLLRVGDADGRRVHTGTVLTVDEPVFERFEPAENPDDNRSFGNTVTSFPETLYWGLRGFGGRLAANRVPAVVALAVIAFGALGRRVVSMPDWVAGLLIFGGSLGLAYVGSGRV